MASRGTLGLVALAASVAVILSMAGCSSASLPAPPSEALASDPSVSPSRTAAMPSPGPGFNNADGVEKEYLAAVQAFPASLPLPEGGHFPASGPTNRPRDVLYSPGAGENEVYFYWRCAWSDAFYTASDAHDTQAITAALDMLEEWPKTAFFAQHVFDSDPGWKAAVVDPARVGDDTVMRKMDGSDCGFFFDANAPG